MENDNNLNGASVLNRISNIYPDLKGALKNVADVIRQYPQDIVKENISKIADRSNTSDSAVVRLSKRLGYKGFRELQISLAYELGDNASYTDEEIEIYDDLESVVKISSKANISALSETERIIDIHSLEKVIDLLQHSRAIHVFAQGANYATGVDLTYNLMKLGTLCYVYNDSYMQSVAAAITNKRDLVIGISHTGANKEVLESLVVTRDNGATTVAITTKENSPITQVADLSLCVSNKEFVFQGEPLTSRISLIYLVDILFLGLASKLGNYSLDVLGSVKSALKNKRHPTDKKITFKNNIN